MTRTSWLLIYQRGRILMTDDRNVIKDDGGKLEEVT